ncbi:MAG TPA: metal-dependent hydrolase [Anaerolineae bacterium]|nr:metal-dependent hydrolase [Anaerolineae bacterium]
MKGIAHFAVGVAVATFVPGVVGAAAQGLAFGPALGGLAGLLPDTLDFKLLRFLEPRDVEIDPAAALNEAGQLDPQALAKALAAALSLAGEQGRKVRLQLHTARLGGDLWQRWSVRFPEGREVQVQLGPAVTTGQLPVPAGDLSAAKVGLAPLPMPILYDYDDEIHVDILSGPSLSVEPAGEALRVTFLPWHRAWSHSLLVVLLIAATGWLLAAARDLSMAPAYGLAMGLAALAHVALDQMGSMGSNFWFPLTHSRTRGLRLWRSGDALPNLLAVWVSGALVLFNLDRFSGAPLLPGLPYLLLAVALPLAAGLASTLWQRKRSVPPLAASMVPGAKAEE